MKSLHEKTLGNHPENPLIKIIGQDCFDFIIKEEFEISNNNSYCFKEYFSDTSDWQEECYKQSFYTGSWDIFVYIFTNGIGVDIDYDCGGMVILLICFFRFQINNNLKKLMIQW